MAYFSISPDCSCQQDVVIVDRLKNILLQIVVHLLCHFSCDVIQSVSIFSSSFSSHVIFCHLSSERGQHDQSHL